MGESNFWSIWTGATFRPRRFFSALPARGGLPPLAFALLVSLASGTGAILEAVLAGGDKSTFGLALATVLLTPIGAFVSIWMTSGLVHLILNAAGGKRPFADTFACICYANAPMLFAAVPLVGRPVGLVWSWVATVIGLRRVQAVSTVRTLGALLCGPILMVALALSLRMFVVEAFRIPSGAMIPTLQVGDHLFVNKVVYRLRAPRRGEVIVFQYPKDPSKDFIKRIVGIAGDTVEGREGVVYVNGGPVAQSPAAGDCSYLDRDEAADRWEERTCRAFVETSGDRSYTVIHDSANRASWPPHTVAADAVFVLGDNRDNSHDSRYWGDVPLELVKGKAMFTWFSSSKARASWFNLIR